MEKEKRFKGVGISPGIAIAEPFFLKENPKAVPNFSISEDRIDHEITRYRHAVKRSKLDIEVLQESYQKEESGVVTEILSAHLELLQDPMVCNAVEEKIRCSKKNSESAYESVIEEYKARFAKEKDPLLSERIKDVVDVSKRVMQHLYPTKKPLQGVSKKALLFCPEIIPTDTYDAINAAIVGFVTRRGGPASHAAIIARAKGIPYIAKLPIEELEKESFKLAILDGEKGVLIINPTAATLEEYQEKKQQYNRHITKIRLESKLPTVTKDGMEAVVYGNIESLSDIEELHTCHAAGVGLFRSEYLFLMEKHFPSEEKQFQIYREIAIRMEKKPVVIRLFDIGNDKNYTFSYWEAQEESAYFFEHEMNPVLGYRALRFLLHNKSILRSQLRAIMRAAVYGNVRILLPFVTDLSEVVLIKKEIKLVAEELYASNIEHRSNLQLGSMIEVPSSALLARAFAKECDFLSIGTNDLTQYMLAVDRTNPKLSYLYSSLHPSILRLIKEIAIAGEKEGVPVIVCGEMAAKALYTKLLLGIGIKGFSMSARSIPLIKEEIRKSSYATSLKLAAKALAATSLQEVEELVQS